MLIDAFACGRCGVHGDRPAMLVRSLDSLERMTWPSGWELLVVDNAPDRTAETIVEARRSAFPAPVLY